MATSYDLVYDVFLRKISDYSFLNMQQTDLENQLKGWLRSAIPKFGKQCYKNLYNRDEVLCQFNADLEDDELEILGTLMIVEWLNPVEYNTQLLRQVLTDRDFKIYSQSQHLDKIMALKSELKKEISNLITKYTYDNGDLGGLG